MRPCFEIFRNFFSLHRMKFLTPDHIQHPNFSLIANFHDLTFKDFNFMRITNLKLSKGFDRE